MEEGQSFVGLLNINQEDDNLLRITPAKALKQPASIQELENCHGKDETVGVPAVVGADLGMTMVPVTCMVPTSVLSPLNFNAMNKRRVNQDDIESRSRKVQGVKESTQLDGIPETSPVNDPVVLTSRLSRRYLDIDNEQAGRSPEKSRGEPTVLRKNRSRRSITLRTSLAWDKAFFTDEGVLDHDELFAVASDAPKGLTMPELASIWDRPQTCVGPCEAKSTPSKTELRPDVRVAVDPNSKQGILHTSLLPETLLGSSRQIHVSESQTSSNACFQVAAVPQGSKSISLLSRSSSTGKRLGAAGRNLFESSQGTGSGMREPRNISTGLYHQARMSAIKKAQESLPLEGPQVGPPYPLTYSNNEWVATLNKKVEDEHYEVLQKAKLPKKMEDKQYEEVHKMKLSKKLEARPSNQIQRMKVIHKKQPELTRSLSTSALFGSAPALSRKVDSMSKKVKEALGKVMAGRAQRVPTEPLLSHVHTVGKESMPSKRSSRLPTVAEVENPSRRINVAAAPVKSGKSNVAAAPVKPSKEIYTVRDILRGSGIPREASKQCPNHMRYKSACGVPDLPRSIDPGLERVETVIVPSAPPPPVRPSEPTGLRKPSPKLGFFDAERATSAPLKVSTTPQPSSAKISANPSAPHLSHGVISAPTSPRGIPKCKSLTGFPKRGNADLPLIQSGIRHAEPNAESPKLPAMKIQIGDVFGTVPEACFKLPDSLSTYAELNAKPTEDVLARCCAESNLFALPSGDSANCGLRQESDGDESAGNTTRREDPIRLENFNPSCEFRSIREAQVEAVNSCEHGTRASMDNDLSASTFPRIPTGNDRSHGLSRTASKQFDHVRSMSCRETCSETKTSTDSPSPASKTVVRALSGKNMGYSSSGLCTATAGVHHNAASPSHSPNAAGTFEVLTPRSKNVRGTPGSSGKKGPRKILEFGSPPSQWSNWPVLGAAISADQMPGSAKELSSSEPKHSGEQATESRPNSSRQAPLEGASNERRASALEQSIHSTSIPSTASKEISAKVVRNPLLESNGAEAAEAAEACSPTVKKELSSSMFTFARKAVRRLTSSPASADSSAQDCEGTSRLSRKINRRFSTAGPEPKPLSPFSEAKLCELEAAGPEILEKKSGPVQNSPPDKVVTEADPWSPVRKNGQPLGPFDCTKRRTSVIL